jgi:hypothetical protein
MCQTGESHRYCLSVHERLRKLGSTAYQSEIVPAIQGSAVFSGRPVPETRRLLDDLYGDAQEAGPLLTASIEAARARSDYIAGLISAAEATVVVDRYAELLRQTGSLIEAIIMKNFLCIISWLEGDDVEAETRLSRHVEEYEALSDRMMLPNALGNWAISLCQLGDAGAALHAVSRGRSLARPDDVADQITLDIAEGYAWALQGEAERAFAYLGRARTAVDTIDMVILAENVAYVEAGARLALGDVDETRALLEGLRDATDARGWRRWADRFRRDLAALD